MKLDRLLAIVMILLNRKQVNAKELAQHFEVSQRTIYRDIEAINQAGIPIVSYMGSDGGFSIMENYQIKKNFLTVDEIGSILTALKNINTTFGSRQISNTLEKIRGMLPEKDASTPGRNAFPVHIDYSSWSTSTADKDKLKIISSAIDEKRIVHFQYINIRGEEMHRIVEPLSLILKDFSWYLNGYCRTKNDFRLFKLKRMSDLALTEEIFTRDVAPIEELRYREDWDHDKILLSMVLKFKPSVKVRVLDTFPHDQIQFEEDGTSIVRFAFPQDDWLVAMLLGFGSDVEVLEPAHLRQLIGQKAMEIARIYSDISHLL